MSKRNQEVLPPVVLIVWRDACQMEAREGGPAGAPQLATLAEVGFLVAEDEEAITLAMEHECEDNIEPGRWRLHIPKSQIKEVHLLTKRRQRAKPVVIDTTAVDVPETPVSAALEVPKKGGTPAQATATAPVPKEVSTIVKS